MKKACMLLTLISVLFMNPVSAQVQEQKNIVTLKIEGMIRQLLVSAPPSEQPVPVAIMDFAATAGRARTQQLGSAVAMMLYDVLNADKRFTLIERDKLGAVMKEVALGQSGLIDEERAVQAGNMVGAQLMITGSVAELGEYFLMSARIIDVKTGQIIANASAEIRQENLLTVSSKYVVIKKYAIAPAFQSAIIPGWGQFYNDQPVKGTLFTIAAGLSAGTVGFSYLFYQNVNYDKAETATEATSAYRQWKLYHQVHLGAIGACAAVWSISVLDAYIVAHNNLKKYRQKESAGIMLEPWFYADLSQKVGTGVRVSF